MNKKAKFSDQAKRLFFNLLGTSKSKAVLSYFYSKKYQKNHFNFPIDTTSIGNVLVILPDEDIEILYQLKNLLTITSQFKSANITVFCESTTSSLVKMVPNIAIVEYEKSEFATDCFVYAKEFKDNFDLCILLNRGPDVSMLSLIGAINAPIRAGYDGAGDYPFLNLKARLSPIPSYISDKNCIIAELFGSKFEPLRMSVGRKTLENIDLVLKNAQLNSNESLIGIDALFFLRQFGENWFDSFLKNVDSVYDGNLYFYVSEKPTTQELNWFGKYKIPLINENKPSKVAALIYRSNLIVAGNSIFYGLAAVLNMPAVGFFKENEFHLYCPNTSNLKGIVYRDNPDDNSITALIHSFGVISGRNKVLS